MSAPRTVHLLVTVVVPNPPHDEDTSAAIRTATQDALAATFTTRVGSVEVAIDDSSADEPTPGQLQVLRMVANGSHHKAIARTLGISLSAVQMRVYRASLILHTKSVTHTIVECIRRGLIEVHG